MARLPELRDLDLDPRLAQTGEAAAVDLRIRVADRSHHARDAGLDDRVGARRRAAEMRARLERDVQRRAARPLARLLERRNLGVRRAVSGVPPFADDLAPAHQHRPDQRMRAFDLPASPLGERKRPLEAHFSAPTSRRYARGRSSRPKIDVPATNRLAPAS